MLFKILDTTRAIVFAGSNSFEVFDWSKDNDWQKCAPKAGSSLVKGLGKNKRKGAIGGTFLDATKNQKYPVLCGGLWVERSWIKWLGMRVFPDYKSHEYKDCINLVTGEKILDLKEKRIFSASVMLDDHRMMIIGGKGAK